MIDIHTHILPNLDDGAQNMDESIEMAKKLKNAGFDSIFATPHIYPGVYNNNKKNILESVEMFKQKLAENNIDLKVYPGAEIFASLDIIKDVDNDSILTMNDKKKFIMLELPFYDFPEYINHVIFALLAKGITPIIAHPERNVKIQEDHNIADIMREKGVKLQVNIGSLAGAYGEKVKETAQSLISGNIIHYIASDMHGVNWQVVEDSKQYLYNNAEEIIWN